MYTFVTWHSVWKALINLFGFMCCRLGSMCGALGAEKVREEHRVLSGPVYLNHEDMARYYCYYSRDPITWDTLCPQAQAHHVVLMSVLPLEMFHASYRLNRARESTPIRSPSLPPSLPLYLSLLLHSYLIWIGLV